MPVKIKLKEIAQAKGISQRQVSLRSGVDIKTIQRITRNPFTVVTTETLDKLSRLLEIDVSELVESVIDDKTSSEN
jgi:DNA-binding Xre family transcriptional regulator